MFFFFNDTATTEIYTLSLHDALPIYEYVMVAVRDRRRLRGGQLRVRDAGKCRQQQRGERQDGSHGRRLYDGSGRRNRSADRKSTRLNSSHANISYAVFCLKKKKKNRR